MTTALREPRTLRVRRERVAPPAAPRRAPERLRFLAAWLPLLAALAALAPARDVWAVQAVLLLLLLVVPGRLLLRALGTPGEAIVNTLVYVPAASLIVLLAAGLGVDLVAGHLGVAKPLRPWPLLAGIEALCLTMLAFAAARAPAGLAIPWRVLQPRVSRAWPLALPLLAAAGAMRLTAGHGGGVAIVAAALACGSLVAGLVVAGRLARSQLSLILYGAGLALAWSFSLRGRFVYGWDITAEYHVLTSTWTSGVWHASHPRDAYGAMLSLTVLPAALHALTGIDSLTLLKAVYPALFALFPVGMFALASRFLSPRYAFVAAAFVAVQSYFFQQLPAIARQEIGLLIFLVLVASVFDARLPLRRRAPWIVLLGAGLAVSHYSTNYMALALFGVAVLLQLVISVFRDIPRMSGALVTAFLVTMIAGVLWNGPVTHSTSNVAAFASNVSEKGLALLPNAQQGQSVMSSYLNGNTPVRISASRYEKLVAQDYMRHRSYITPLPSASDPRYALRDAHVPGGIPARPAVDQLLGNAYLLASQAFNVLAVVAALLLALRRRVSPALRLLGVLGLSTLAALAFVRLSGTAANDYNQSRAFLQTMVPLAVAIGWLLERLAGARSRRYWPVTLVATGALATILATTSGLRGVASGGATPTNLANGGEDYERFYVTQPEIAAAKWLAAAAPRTGLIYTDRYGQLRVFEATARSTGLFLDPTPKTLDQHAWVLGTRVNVVERRARGQDGSKYAVYRWPVSFLRDRFDEIYSNGSSEVWHR